MNTSLVRLYLVQICSKLRSQIEIDYASIFLNFVALKIKNVST